MIATIFAAIVVMGLCAAFLLIGWLITGKVKLRKGTCSPKDKSGACSICGSKKREDACKK